MMEPRPIFVLCCARSGSTLLRYVLDTHPAIACPPELHLLLTARHLLWLHEHTARAGQQSDASIDAAALATERTRVMIESVMRDHVERAGKTNWAEKSVSSVDALDVLERVFPDAQLVCLYRNARDVMASCAQAGQQQRGTFGFEPYVARSQDNPVDGLADYWLDKTQRVLDAERRATHATIRIRYEDLVTEPATTIAALLEWLGLAMPDDMLDSIFTATHVVGPGDSKILSTTGIHRDSVGHGSKLVLDGLSANRRAGIDELHGELGYSALGRQ